MHVLIFWTFYVQTVPALAPAETLPIYLVPPAQSMAEFSNKTACEAFAAAAKVELQKALEPHVVKVAWICKAKA